MLSEIDKDARAIAALQQEVRELREQCVSNMHCIVALEEEIRFLKAQQTKDYTQLMSISTHQTESLGQQETGLAKLRQELQDQTKRSTAFEKETRVCLDRIVSPATERFLTGFITGEKTRLVSLCGSSNIFVLQVKGFTQTILSQQEDLNIAANVFFSEKSCWIISVHHVVKNGIKASGFKLEDRELLTTFLLDHMVHRNDPANQYEVYFYKRFIPAFSHVQVCSEFFSGGFRMTGYPTYQPTLIEFVS